MRSGTYSLRSISCIILTVSSNEQAGGIFIDRALTSLLRNKLKPSRYGTDDVVYEIVRKFEEKVIIHEDITFQC